jgi:hypothetical protein
VSLPKSYVRVRITLFEDKVFTELNILKWWH